MKRQSGFTIIEIMIVTVIIGILAVVAIRAANGYAVRAKVSEAVLALSTCRTVVAEYMMSADALPTASDSYGCEGSGTSKYVDTISTTTSGIIKVGLRDGTSRVFRPGQHFYAADTLPDGATFDANLHGHWSAQRGAYPLVTLFLKT